MSKDQVLEKLLYQLKNKFSLVTFNTVLKDLKIYSFNNGEIILTIDSDNDLLLQTIEKNYKTEIEDILNDILNDSCKIIFKQNKDIIEQENTEKIKKSIEQNYQASFEDDIVNYKYSSNFNELYTFDTFVVGASNRMAYEAALSVAKNPGKLYNPFFLYANSGLGKTHLMHAIGNYIVTNSDKKVLYVTAETFKSDFTASQSTRSNNSNVKYMQAFREKYRNVDVLIIDDIQLLENWEKTQIEFYNTFNELHDANKQIIMASDRSVNDFKMMEDRLKTRFKWGLPVCIQPPEIELKKNIIKNKIIVNDLDLNLTEEIIDYIANNCGPNVRDLEGSLKRLFAYKIFMRIDEFTLGIAQDALEEYVTTRVYKTNNVAKILDIVAKYYGIDTSMLKGKMRKKEIVNARDVAVYLCLILTDETQDRIGLEMGGRDHSTIIHSRDKIEKELKTNTTLQEEIKILKDKICE